MERQTIWLITKEEGGQRAREMGKSADKRVRAFVLLIKLIKNGFQNTLSLPSFF